MITKISVIVVEVSGEFDPFGRPNCRILVDNNGDLPSKPISTKSEMDTLQELLYEVCTLDIRYSPFDLVDFYHLAGSSECNVVYSTRVPSDSICVKSGYFEYVEALTTRKEYDRAIQRVARF